jgi:hypothetical protein
MKEEMRNEEDAMNHTQERHRPDEDKVDPEPIAVVTLCIATIMMANAVANTFINYKKYIRDEEERQGDAEWNSS